MRDHHHHRRPQSLVRGMISVIQSLTIGTVVGLGSFLGFPVAALVKEFSTPKGATTTTTDEDTSTQQQWFESLLGLHDATTTTTTTTTTEAIRTNKLLESSSRILLASLSGIVTGALVGIPICTVCGIHAAYSILVGTVATPFTVAAVLAGMEWDPTTQHWIQSCRCPGKNVHPNVKSFQ
jgi:hypothetical protein